MSRKIEFLVVLGDGGHSAEIIRLVELMGPDHNYSYAITTSDRVSENNLTIPGPVYRITRPRAKDDNVWQAALKLTRSFWQAAWLLYQIRPDVVLGSGPAVMVPIALLGRLTGARIIYVETGCRVTDLSLTGKIMLKVAHLFFVQWEQLQKLYPHTIFAGRLL